MPTTYGTSATAYDVQRWANKAAKAKAKAAKWQRRAEAAESRYIQARYNHR